MKNQYFGDINDYRRNGLLRVVTSRRALETAVCWMLSPEDESIERTAGSMSKHP